MSADNRSEPGLSSALWESLTLGKRFAIRYRTGPSERLPFTDVVGTVEDITDAAVTVRTRRHGLVTVSRHTITAARHIPAAISRRNQPHRAITVEHLERVAVGGWLPIERSYLGDWLLRAADGYTGRANSALAVGHPDRPIVDAFSAVQQWHAERGLTPLLQVPLPPAAQPADDVLVSDAVSAGWEWFQLTDVMTAATHDVASAARPLTERETLTITTTCSEQWWSLADERMNAAPQAARAVLDGSADARFITLTRDDLLAARGRIALAQGWGGIHAVATAAEFRRQGLASAVMGACAAEASAAGAESLYLQVSADNTEAIGLYKNLGFTRHHQYVYLRPTQWPPA